MVQNYDEGQPITIESLWGIHIPCWSLILNPSLRVLLCKQREQQTAGTVGFGGENREVFVLAPDYAEMFWV